VLLVNLELAFRERGRKNSSRKNEEKKTKGKGKREREIEKEAQTRRKRKENQSDSFGKSERGTIGPFDLENPRAEGEGLADSLCHNT